MVEKKGKKKRDRQTEIENNDRTTDRETSRQNFVKQNIAMFFGRFSATYEKKNKGLIWRISVDLMEKARVQRIFLGRVGIFLLRNQPSNDACLL